MKKSVSLGLIARYVSSWTMAQSELRISSSVNSDEQLNRRSTEVSDVIRTNDGEVQAD